MLFCYFLNRNDFKLHAAPESASKDKAYAYSLYLDLLLMTLRLSGFHAGKRLSDYSNKYLISNRISKALSSDPSIKDAIYKRIDEAPRYDAALENIYSSIIDSAIYRSFTHRKDKSITDDIDFWTTVIATIFVKSKELLAAARTDEGFTNVGYETAFKWLDDTIRSCGSSRRLFIDSRKALESSLDKAYELYNSLLILPQSLVELQDRRLDNARNKYLATADDLNPNLKFIDNQMIPALAAESKLTDYVKDKKIDWHADPDFLMAILDKIVESDLYASYMADATTSLEADCEFWRQVMKQIILPSDELAELLESKSVYWNDDLEIIGTFVCKTFRRVARSEAGSNESVILPRFKDKEDEKFGDELFVDVIDNFDLYRSYIDRFINSNQWDPERLAFMDVVIMCTAISELLNYPAIPIPVTLNEYIEIANYYSTPRSGQFINGILYSLINYLRQEGKLMKK